MSDLQLYNLTLPDDVKIFTVPRANICRWDKEFFVCDIGADANQVQRQYLFYERWFKLHCGLGRSGAFVPEAMTSTAFHVTCCTPFWSIGMVGYTTGLIVDIAVAADGRQHTVTGLEHLEAAVVRGWVTQAERDCAMRGFEEALKLVQAGHLLWFMDQTQPLSHLAPVVELPPPIHKRLGRVPLMHRDMRRRYFGHRLAPNATLP